MQLVEDRERSHGKATLFMGSLVLALTADIGPAGLSRYLVVDGQQRLTTLTLLLAAVRDHRASLLLGVKSFHRSSNPSISPTRRSPS